MIMLCEETRSAGGRRGHRRRPRLAGVQLRGGVPFARVAADEVYGRGSRLREACAKAGKGYVFAVPVNRTVTLPSGRKTSVTAVARRGPADPAHGAGDPLVRALRVADRVGDVQHGPHGTVSRPRRDTSLVLQ